MCPPNEGDLKSWSQWLVVLSLGRRCLHHQDSSEERGTLSAETAARILSGEIWTLREGGASNEATKEGKGREEEKEGKGYFTIAKTKPGFSSIRKHTCSAKHTILQTLDDIVKTVVRLCNMSCVLGGVVVLYIS